MPIANRTKISFLRQNRPIINKIIIDKIRIILTFFVQRFRIIIANFNQETSVMYDDYEKTQSIDDYSPYNGGQQNYNTGRPQYNGGYGSGYENYPPNNNQGSSNTIIIAIIVAALVIILGLGGVVTFVLINKNSENNDSKSKKEPITTTIAVTENQVSAATEAATVAVINVEGYKAEDAYQMLNDAGIKYTISRQNSDNVEEGYVISQSPKDGFIKSSDKLIIYVSKGSSKPKTSSQAVTAPQSSAPPVNNYNYYINGNGGGNTNNNRGSSEYIIPDSNSRYLSESEVRSLSRSDMNFAINEIYARKGRIFKDSTLRSYFNSKSWYHGTVDPAIFDSHIYSYLNSIEIANVNLIDKVQKNLGYK